MTFRNRSDVVNFGAGPANFPTEVLEQVRDELLNWNGCGMSVMELSHRSKYFDEIQNTTISLARELLNIPDSYDTLFAQGGASTQFSSVPLNMLSSSDSVADYLVTGGWSAKAQEEAAVFGKSNIVANGKHPQCKVYTTMPSPDTWSLSKNSEYFYYCENETVFGVELQKDIIPSILESEYNKRDFGKPPPPIVADVSSNFYSRSINISDYAVVYGGAQKNLGPAGVTFLIVNKEFSRNEPKYSKVPNMLKWNTLACNDSRFNTPPTFSIYVMGRCLQWLKDIGGVSAMEDINNEKSNLVYNVLDNYPLYRNLVDKEFRSRMNIPFRIVKSGSDGYEWDDNLESKFLKEAEAEGLLMLKGHRSAGGMRASLYNSITLDETKKLVAFLERFADNNSSQ